MTSVAFVGLGVMGRGMAGRLLDAGFPLAVWNRRRDRTDALAERGARLATSPHDAAAGADVIVSMVADDDASKAVWLGAEGLLAGARPGTLLIESSTLSPAWIVELDVHAREKGCQLIDAPVTGSRTHAAAGQLLFLVGGSDDAMERARPLLTAMGREALHLGPVGSGARLKLINNFVCGVQAAALAEELALIELSGLDRDTAFRVLANGAPGSPLVNAVGPRMTAGDYTVHFQLALMRKDLAYAVNEGERYGLRLRTALVARDLFDDAVAAHLGREDFSAVIEPLRRQPRA